MATSELVQHFPSAVTVEDSAFPLTVLVPAYNEARRIAPTLRRLREFFAAEPGAEVEVTEADDRVTLYVKVCPAIRHLREHGRELQMRL